MGVGVVKHVNREILHSIPLEEGVLHINARFNSAHA